MDARECPLCARSDAAHALVAHGRDLYRCAGCDLLFVAPEQRLDARAERAHYLTHENRPDDPGYRAFLDRLLAPLASRLAPGSHGLDYGSGPGPTAHLVLGERGLPTDNYDPLFAPDTGQLSRVYDFVACTETAEHFHHPGREFERIHGLVRPGGCIGIMTERVDERLRASWWYLRDPTHVCFYSMATMEWLGQRLGWTLAERGPGVVIFER